MKLSHDNLVVGNCVTLDRDITDTCLLALDNTYLYVYGVILHGHLYGSGAEEQVTIIHVQGGDISTRGVVADIHVQLLLVIGVTLVDTKCTVQDFITIYRVATEGYITEEIALAFIDLDLDFKHISVGLCRLVLRYIPHGVTDYTSIAESLLIIVCNNLIKVFPEVILNIPALLPETLGPEQKFPEVMHIMGLLHLAL